MRSPGRYVEKTCLLEVRDGGCDERNLLDEAVDELGLVAASDLSRPACRTAAWRAAACLVAFGVDDPHAGRRDRDVLDVRRESRIRRSCRTRTSRHCLASACSMSSSPQARRAQLRSCCGASCSARITQPTRGTLPDTRFAPGLASLRPRAGRLRQRCRWLRLGRSGAEGRCTQRAPSTMRRPGCGNGRATAAFGRLR